MQQASSSAPNRRPNARQTVISFLFMFCVAALAAPQNRANSKQMQTLFCAIKTRPPPPTHPPPPPHSTAALPPPHRRRRRRTAGPATQSRAGKRHQTGKNRHSEKDGNSESILANRTKPPVLAQNMPFLASESLLRVVTAKSTPQKAFSPKKHPKLAPKTRTPFLESSSPLQIKKVVRQTSGGLGSGGSGSPLSSFFFKSKVKTT